MALLRLLCGAGHPQNVETVGVYLLPFGHLHQRPQVAGAGDNTETGLRVAFLQQGDDRRQWIAGGEDQFREVVPLAKEIRHGAHNRPPQANDAVQFGKFLRHVGAQGVQKIGLGHLVLLGYMLRITCFVFRYE